jgi:hypothetical protein
MSVAVPERSASASEGATAQTVESASPWKSSHILPAFEGPGTDVSGVEEASVFEPMTGPRNREERNPIPRVAKSKRESQAEAL